jgi:hypothetical protein
MEWPFELNTDEFREEGLYLFFPDKNSIRITKTGIDRYFKKVTKEYRSFPVGVRKHPDFAACEHCRTRAKRQRFCSALMPVLPFLDEVDKYVSFDAVAAVFKNNITGFITMKRTSLQEVLKYVSLLSLTRYCRINRKYWKYFFGVRALSSPEQVVSQIYLNFYWIYKGDHDRVRKETHTFVQEIGKSARSLVARLRLICRNDAFLNAFINAQLATEFLEIDISKTLDKAFETHNRRFTSDGVVG